jgi:hypothetical protein
MFANAACEVWNYPMRSWPSLHAEFGQKARSVLQHPSWLLYFLCFLLQNASSQTADFKGKRVLSPYFPFRVEKCHPTKNKPSANDSSGRIFTNQQAFPNSHSAFSNDFLSGLERIFLHNAFHYQLFFVILQGNMY